MSRPNCPVVFSQIFAAITRTNMAANSFTELSDKLDVLTLLLAEMNYKIQEASKPADTPLSVEESEKYRG